MTLPLRHRVLAGAAFVTALGTGYVANLDEAPGAEAGAPGPAREPGPAGTAPGGPGRSASLQRGDWPAPTADALRAWGAAAPNDATDGTAVARPAPGARPNAVAPRVAEAALPAAPPEPAPPAWRLIGRIDEAGVARALLATPQQLIVVAESDTLDGRWRVERIDAEAVQLRALAGGAALRLAWEAAR